MTATIIKLRNRLDHVDDIIACISEYGVQISKFSFWETDTYFAIAYFVILEILSLYFGRHLIINYLLLINAYEKP